MPDPFVCACLGPKKCTKDWCEIRQKYLRRQKMDLKPTPDVIVLKGYEPPKMTDGGIALPQNVRREANSDKIAEVVEVGENVTLVSVGDKVAWSPANVIAVNFGQETGTLYFVKEENILAHISD